MHSFLQRKGGLIAKGAALKKVVGMGGAYHKIEVPPGSCGTPTAFCGRIIIIKYRKNNLSNPTLKIYQ